MPAPNHPLSLSEWRREVAEIYASLRREAATKPYHAWERFRTRRDRLFRDHPQTPLPSRQRAQFEGLSFYPYDSAWRITAAVVPTENGVSTELDLPIGGRVRYTPIAELRFTASGGDRQLALYWIEGYGGGLFLPFGDTTSGRTTYGGGRYLYDTVKGADLGATTDTLILDFNFAYNPSCAYDDRWGCPLAPPENRLPFAIEAGERTFDGATKERNGQ